jgi:hypothetical protein
MRKISLYITVIIGVLLLNNCKKDPDLRMPDMKKGVTPSLSWSGSSTIDYNNQSAFEGSIEVDLYFKTDKPQSMDLIVVYNDDTENAAMLRSNITTFPTIVNFDLDTLLALLPQIDTLNLKDKFNFYVNITLEDGTYIGALDTLYTQSSPDVNNYPDNYVDLSLGFFCPLNIDDFTGAYDCDESGYGVYSISFTLDPVVVNRIHNDNFWDWAGPGQTLYYDLSGDNDQIVTVPEQPFVYGDGSEGKVSGTGTYDGCSGTMIVDYKVTYDGSVYDTHHEFAPAAKKSASFILKSKSERFK